MRKVLIAAGVVSMVSMAMAQKLEFGIDGGYGIGVGTSLVGQNIANNVNGDMIKYDQVYASEGKGTKIMGEVAFFPFENIGNYGCIRIFAEEQLYLLFYDPSGGLLSSKGTTSYLSINIGLKFRAKLGIVEPYAYVAPGIYLPHKTVDTTSTPTSGVGGMTYTSTYTYAIGFGVAAGVGAKVILPFFSDRVGIKVEFAPTYAFANPTKYSEHTSNGTTTYTFKNNTPPNNLAPNEISDQPHDFFCSMAVMAGLCLKIF